MPWYKAGTVSVTKNSNAVIGSGTAFIANSRVGDAFRGPDGDWYEVINIASDTAMAIAPPYRGTTVSGAEYSLTPVQGYVKASADRLNEILHEIENVSDSVIEAAASATAAQGSADQAGDYAALAQGSADASAASAQAASGSEQAAAGHETASAQSVLDSQAARDAAIGYRDQAQAAQQQSSSSAAAAQASAAAAAQSEQNVSHKANSGVNSDITELQALTVPLSIAQGGTGVKTIEDLRNALGSSKSQYKAGQGSLSGSVLTFDIQTADLLTAQLTSNISLALPVTGLPSTGQAYVARCVFSQSGSGGFNVTPPSGTLLPDGIGSLVSTSAGAVTYLELTMIAGSYWMVTQRTTFTMDLPYAIPPIADDNAFFNDEGTSTTGWTATGGTLSVASSFLRLTKTAAAGTGCSASKNMTMPSAASDFIIYGSLRANSTGVYTAWILNGSKEFSIWLGTSAASSVATPGAVSMAGYTTSRLVASVASGLSYDTTAVNFALQYDNKFGTLTAWLRQSDGTWRFGNRVLSTWFSAPSVTLAHASANAAGAWIEADFLTVSLPNIVAIGDSVVEGKTLFSPDPSLNLTNYDSTWMRYSNIYPALRNNLIVNKGVGGNSSTQMLARVSDVTSTGARTVVHQMSSNDFVQGVSQTTRTSNTQSSLNAYSGAGMNTVLANAMYGTATTNGNTGSGLRDYVINWWTAGRKAVTGVYSAVDIAQVMKGSDGYQNSSLTQSDGIHPTPAGYALIGAKIATPG